MSDASPADVLAELKRLRRICHEGSNFALDCRADSILLSRDGTDVEVFADDMAAELRDAARSCDALIALATQSSADSRDAARYRWLREHDESEIYSEYTDGLLNDRFGGDDLDAAVDAAKERSE